MKKRRINVKIRIAAAMFLVCACVLTPACKQKRQVVVSGSSSSAPLVQKLAYEYEQKNPGVKIKVFISDTGTGISDAAGGKSDFGMASRALKTSETGCDAVKICDDGVAVIVHPDSAMENVTGGEIYGLYKDGAAVQGSITAAVSREEGSGTRDAFDALIRNGAGETLQELSAFHPSVSLQNSTGAIKMEIAADKNAQKIAYISFGSLDSTVKALDFNGVPAEAENVKNGTYALSRPFLLVQKKGAELKKEAKGFLEWILSEEGRETIRREGYIA